jgi:hypothetical protein
MPARVSASVASLPRAADPELSIFRLEREGEGEGEGEVIKALLAHAENLGDAGNGADEARRGQAGRLGEGTPGASSDRSS